MRRQKTPYIRSTEMFNGPLPPLQPYPRCRCGVCRECVDNAKWDRVFAKFEKKQYWDQRGMLQSALNDF